MRSIRCFRIALISAVVAVVASACVSVPPPIQQMSDARLAIAAARDAGAAKYAALTLEEAVILMRSAEQNIERRAYAAASRDAALAKSMATEARETAENADGKQPRATEQPLKEGS